MFQLESTGMRDVLRKLKPDRFEDIIAMVALYRPGPMDNIETYVNRKHGRGADYLHPLLKPILEDTYGVIIYQEQVMQARAGSGGLQPGRGRSAAPRDGQEDQGRDGRAARPFRQRREGEGHQGGPRGLIFDQVDKFAGYGFNKATRPPTR